MTALREAAQQLLGALDKSLYMNDYCGLEVSKHDQPDVTNAIENLRAALAEPVQEPVAWRWGYRSVTTGEMDWRGYVEIAAHPNLRSPAIIMEPLYTAPPQRPAEPQEPFALPCPTPKACKAHCCSGNCIPRSKA